MKIKNLKDFNRKKYYNKTYDTFTKKPKETKKCNFCKNYNALYVLTYNTKAVNDKTSYLFYFVDGYFCSKKCYLSTSLTSLFYKKFKGNFQKLKLIPIKKLNYLAQKYDYLDTDFIDDNVPF